MSRPGPDIQASEDAVSAPPRRADNTIRAATGVTVAALVGIAEAISYSHMRELVVAHGETGWQAHTFPLSVDGIEMVASLVLLADRRTGRSSGWLPWTALAAGTTASLAANVAAAGADLVGRAVAGWPAFALLVAVKLLSQLLEPSHSGGRPKLAGDRPVPRHGGASPATAVRRSAGTIWTWRSVPCRWLPPMPTVPRMATSQPGSAASWMPDRSQRLLRPALRAARLPAFVAIRLVGVDVRDVAQSGPARPVTAVPGNR